jgi:hypothetical protein
MTDTGTTANGSSSTAVDDLGPLPYLVTVSTAFATRILPNQRVVDAIARVEPSTPFGELMQTQGSRVIAFRALLRDHPHRDPASLWLHAYDVEVEIVGTLDPTEIASLTPSPPSSVTGA